MKQNGIIWKVLFFSILYVFLFPPSSFSAVYQITDAASNTNASLYDGAIAWQGNVDGDWEIYYWDGSYDAFGSPNIEQITNNTVSDVQPTLYNEAIAWTRADVTAGDFDIYYWNGSYDVDGSPVIQQITDNSVADFNPSLYSGTIAWTRDGDGDSEIYYWDGSYGVGGSPNIEQITNNTVTDYDPSLYNGTIAWQSNLDGDNEIYYWDGTYDIGGSPDIEQITNNTVYDYNPSLFGGAIAWQSGEEIYYWDGTYDIGGSPNIEQITNNTVSDGWPSLYGGAIAWLSQDGGDNEIHYWDGSYDVDDSPIIQNITDNTVSDFAPSLYNGTIAWTRIISADGDIYYWDGDSILPVAKAGSDQVVFDMVTLDGSASYNDDGYIVSYDWLLEYRGDPTHNTAAISVDPTITIPDLYSGFYDVTLTVTDDEGATSTDTLVVAAAGACDCSASTMYIKSIVAGTVRGSKGNSHGEVIVTVFDDYGNPVAGATVYGTFYSPFDETSSGVTDGNGIAVIRTSEQVKKPLYNFCVDDVVKDPLTYDNDVETCVNN